LLANINVKGKKNMHQGAKVKASLSVEFKEANVRLPVSVEIFDKEKGKIINKRVKDLKSGPIRIMKGEYFKVVNNSVS